MRESYRKRYPDLDRSLAAWHGADEAAESFSHAAREGVLHAGAGRAPAPAPLAGLFLPVRRLALAGVLPVLLLSAMLGYLTLPGTGEPAEVPGTLTAQKQGNQVIFVIANGDRSHQVLRSEEPDFKGATAFTTSNGRFVDRLEGGPDLVFYRID